MGFTFDDSIQLWIAFGNWINLYHRNPGEITEESRLWVKNLVSVLDTIIAKSVIPPEQLSAISHDSNPLFFRAVSGPYAKEIIDSVHAGVFSIEPNPNFESWTANIEAAKRKITGGESPYNVIFISEYPNLEPAFYVGGEDYEILYPRNTSWRIITHSTRADHGKPISFVYVKRKFVRE